MAETRRILLGTIKSTCGLLALALLKWTPRTGTGVLIYAVLFAVLIALAIALSPRKHEGYWPGKPEDQ
jgi:hypothetical protein